MSGRNGACTEPLEAIMRREACSITNLLRRQRTKKYLGDVSIRVEMKALKEDRGGHSFRITELGTGRQSHDVVIGTRYGFEQVVACRS